MSNVENIGQSIGEKEFNTGAATVAAIAQELPQTERDKLLNAIQVMREGAAEHVDDFREQLKNAKGFLEGKNAAINMLDLIVEQQAESIRKYQEVEKQHLFAIEQLKAELSKHTGPFVKSKPLFRGSIDYTGAGRYPVEPGVYRVWLDCDLNFNEDVHHYSVWTGDHWRIVCTTIEHTIQQTGKQNTTSNPITAWRELSGEESSNALRAAKDMIVTVTNKADTQVEVAQDAPTQNVTLKLGVDTANYKEALSMADTYFARLHGALLATTPVENQAKVDEMVKDFTGVIANVLKAASNSAEPPKVIQNVVTIPSMTTAKMIGFDEHGRYWVASGAGWKEPGREFQALFDSMRVKLELEPPQLKLANSSLAGKFGEVAIKLNEHNSSKTVIWRERWYGSGGAEGLEGWSIVDNETGELVVHFGRNIENCVVSTIVRKHNDAIGAAVIPTMSSVRPPQPGIYKVFVNRFDVLAGWAKWDGHDWFSIQQSKDEAFRSTISRSKLEAPITRWERWV